MPQGEKSASTDKQKRRAPAVEKGHTGQKSVPRPEASARSTVNKLHGGGKKMDSRRKVPFGPVGGLGRKTNLARSS
jgi:hypothetical protein